MEGVEGVEEVEGVESEKTMLMELEEVVVDGSNSLSVPKEFVERIKLDNVKYMLEQHQEMMKHMYAQQEQ